MRNFATRFLPVSTLVFFFGSISFSQYNNDMSTTPAPYCVGLTYTANATGAMAAGLEPGNDYGCLFSTPNPSWFFLKAETAGDIQLNLYAPNDIDFILYGPFSSLTDMSLSAGSLNASQVIDCSYSGTNNEFISIPPMTVGDYYLILVTNYASVVQPIDLTQVGGTGSLDCSVYDDLVYHHIYGKTFFDFNQNGIFDTDDYYMPSVDVTIDPVSQTLISNADGTFEYFYMNPDSVNYTVTAVLPEWNNTTATNYQFYLDSTNENSDTLLFGFYPDSAYYSTSIDIVNSTTFCATDNAAWITVTNDGTLASSGSLVVTLDTDLPFVSTDYPADMISGNQVIYSYDSLLPFEQLNIHIVTSPGTVLTGMDTILNVVDLTTYDSLLIVQGNASDSMTSPVVCSYDPNNKISLPNGTMDLTDNIISQNDHLEYIINFQNTGTASAVDVIIVDTLSNLLDISTFEFLSSSHTPLISVGGDYIIKFNFENINLPDSTTNEPMSKGYVKFRIGLSSTVLPNDQVNNTANIYFDNNQPVITNTTNNILDCFISPGDAQLYVDAGAIQTDITLTGNTFEWYFDGNLITGAVTNSVALQGDGTYTVVITGAYGCQETESYILTTAGLDENEMAVSVYPNPSDNYFTVKFENAGDYQIRLSDLSGKLILSDIRTVLNEYVIDASDLAPGVYLLTLKNAEGFSTQVQLVKK